MNKDKLRREFFEECTDIVEGLPKINLSPNDLINWFIDKIRKRNRSTKANNLYWKWMQCLEHETGQDKNDYHKYFKQKFIGTKIEKGLKNVDIIIEPSTKKMLSKPFNYYMKKVQAEAATEFNVVVPLPEDLGFDEFYNKYSNY